MIPHNPSRTITPKTAKEHPDARHLWTATEEFLSFFFKWDSDWTVALFQGNFRKAWAVTLLIFCRPARVLQIPVQNNEPEEEHHQSTLSPCSWWSWITTAILALGTSPSGPTVMLQVYTTVPPRMAPLFSASSHKKLSHNVQHFASSIWKAQGLFQHFQRTVGLLSVKYHRMSWITKNHTHQYATHKVQRAKTGNDSFNRESGQVFTHTLEDTHTHTHIVMHTHT